VTLLLTTAAFKQSFSSSLQPPVAYLTLLDQYALGAAGFLVLAVLMYASAGPSYFAAKWMPKGKTGESEAR
jgi:hypothetical protein